MSKLISHRVLHTEISFPCRYDRMYWWDQAGHTVCVSTGGGGVRAGYTTEDRSPSPICARNKWTTELVMPNSLGRPSWNSVSICLSLFDYKHAQQCSTFMFSACILNVCKHKNLQPHSRHKMQKQYLNKPKANLMSWTIISICISCEFSQNWSFFLWDPHKRDTGSCWVMFFTLESPDLLTTPLIFLNPPSSLCVPLLAVIHLSQLSGLKQVYIKPWATQVPGRSACPPNPEQPRYLGSQPAHPTLGAQPAHSLSNLISYFQFCFSSQPSPTLHLHSPAHSH